MHVFSAAVTLILEMHGSKTSVPEYITCISEGKDFLEKVKSHNMIAKQGLEMLNEMLST